MGAVYYRTMRLFGVAIVTIWGLAACGRDPILEKAEAEAAARRARATEARGETAPPAGVPGAPPAGEPGAGVPGAAQPGDPSGGPFGEVGPDGQPLPGIPEEPAPGVPTEPPPGAPGAPPEAVPGSAAPVDPSAPRPGIPMEPAPGIPDQPPPGAGAAGAPLGPTVAVSGEIVYADWRAGSIRITAFDGDHALTTGKRPNVIAFADVDRPGPFLLNVPEKAGKVYIEAALDENGDGRPGPLDPQGQADRFPVTVAEKPVSGVEIRLKRREPPPGGRGQDY